MLVYDIKTEEEMGKYQELKYSTEEIRSERRGIYVSEKDVRNGKKGKDAGTGKRIDREMQNIL